MEPSCSSTTTNLDEATKMVEVNLNSADQDAATRKAELAADSADRVAATKMEEIVTDSTEQFAETKMKGIGGDSENQDSATRKEEVIADSTEQDETTKMLMDKGDSSEPGEATEIEEIVAGAVGDDHDDTAVDDNDSGDKGETSETQDEYGYIKRDPMSSELYKVFVKNVGSYFGFKECKKKLSALDLKPVKLKKWRDNIYVTFRNEEERERAIQKLDGQVWRGNTLKAVKAAPHVDPLVKKRKQERETGEDSNQKKVKDEEEGLTPSERLKNSVTPLWNMSYEEQLKKKADTIKETLKRFHKSFGKNCPDLYGWLSQQGKLYDGLPCELLDIIPSPLTEGYRNKCEFTIGPGLDGKESVVGFRYGLYAQGTVHVGSPEEISFVPETMKNVIKAFQSYLDSSTYKAFSPVTHTGYWRQLTMRTSRLGHVMAMVDFHPQQLSKESIEEVVEALKNYFQSGEGSSCGITTLYFRTHTEKMTGASTDSPFRLLFGEEQITESLLGMKFRISPNAFFQVNTAAAEILYSKIAEWCNSTPNTVVLDICCGTGTIGQCVAKSVAKVIGVELNTEAVEDAKVNASLNDITNVEYHCGKAEELIKRITLSTARHEDVVAVLDPPRGGLNASVITTIRYCRHVKRVVYVSCNPNGALNNFIDLIRPQSKRLKGPRFYPVKAVPVDLFPSTNHCELLVLFEREGNQPEPV